jgi:hypothetical protein
MDEKPPLEIPRIGAEDWEQTQPASDGDALIGLEVI